MKASMQLPFSAVCVVLLPVTALNRLATGQHWWAAMWVAIWIGQCWLFADSFKKVRRAEKDAK